MRVLEIRPARIQAKLVEIGDMLVSSPHSGDGNHEREPRWIGRVTDFITVGGPLFRQWRIEQPNGVHIESAPVPVDAFVWVHLPSAPEPMVPYPAELMAPKSTAEIMREAAGENRP